MNSSDNGMTVFCVWLKNALQEANMSQAELARIMETDQGFISRIINGRINPSGSTMLKLLEIFNARMIIVPAGEEKKSEIVDEQTEDKTIYYGDDLEKCIYRYSVAGFDMGLEDEDDYIPVIILKQILDHFVPKWRKREDRYYKLKKFVTEQQMDKNLSKIRDLIDKKYGVLTQEINKFHEYVDEYEVKMAEVDRIIEAEKIAIERVRIMQSKENTEG